MESGGGGQTPLSRVIGISGRQLNGSIENISPFSPVESTLEFVLDKNEQVLFEGKGEGL